MAKVIATEAGYFGGELRVAGAGFTVPDEIWDDETRRPKWARIDPRFAFGGKGDHDGDGRVGGSRPLSQRVNDAKNSGGEAEKAPKAVVVPADWKSRPAKERRALAVEIIGKPVPNAAEADKVIEAYVQSAKPEVFGDAPAPVTDLGNGVQQALENAGGMQPDWIAPGAIEPVDD